MGALFVDQIPNHQRRICAADSDQCPIAIQKSYRSKDARIDFGLVVLAAWTDARISVWDEVGIRIWEIQLKMK